MKIAVLFDGAGLARLGLEQAGHECTGFELDPWKHYLSRFVGSGNCILLDATKADLSDFEAVWASPPCQLRSSARTQGSPTSPYAGDFIEWSLNIDKSVLWVENVIPQGKLPSWGKAYNAGQFLKEPIQNRNRMIGGRFIEPFTHREYKKFYPSICPCITATEYKGCATDVRRASRFYGRKLSLEECAFHQGFIIPKEWYQIPSQFLKDTNLKKSSFANRPVTNTETDWINNIYEAVGNGVPVYMAKAFGLCYRV